MRIILILTGLMLFCGCTKPLSDELKVLQPVTITVTNGGKPIEGAIVVLEGTVGQGAWGANAVTTADGSAVIKTNLGSQSRSGVKPGSYKIIVKKETKLPPELSPDDTSSMPEKDRKALEEKIKKFMAENNTIPAAFGDAKTTPLTVTVGDSPVTQAVDVAKK